MIDDAFAPRFADEWVEAWNSHDLDRILAHYRDDFEMSSPIITAMMGEPSGVLKGKSSVRAYWAKALDLLPDLHFELVDVLAGVSSITLYYRGTRGMVAEVLQLDAEGKVAKGSAHYAVARTPAP